MSKKNGKRKDGASKKFPKFDERRTFSKYQPEPTEAIAVRPSDITYGAMPPDIFDAGVLRYGDSCIAATIPPLRAPPKPLNKGKGKKRHKE